VRETATPPTSRAAIFQDVNVVVDTIDFADELRDLQSWARRECGRGHRPKKRDVSAAVADSLRSDAGRHGGGYVAAPTAFGGCRWHYRCPGCGARVQRLYRLIGADGFACRNCLRLRAGFGSGIGRALSTLAALDAFTGRRGRRPRRYRRLVAQAPKQLDVLRNAAAILVGVPPKPKRTLDTGEKLG